MPGRQGWLLRVVVFGVLTAGLPTADGAESPGPAVLARAIPADARLFLEFRGFDSLSGTPFDPMLARMLGGVLTATRPATGPGDATQPPGQPGGWRLWFARTVGLTNPKAVDLLFTGPVAFAAEGWSGLGDAILLVEPKDAAAFEAAIGAQPASASRRVRRYRLTHEHELACNGRNVVLGRAGNTPNLYFRTVALWESEGGATLGEIAEFRERTAGLPAGMQVLFYAGTRARPGEPPPILGQWWPAGWSDLRSLAIGAGISAAGLSVDVNGRLDSQSKPGATPPLAVEALSRLPASVVAAWTQPLDFVDTMRRLIAADADGTVRSLLAEVPGGGVDWQLLGHFVGSAVFVVAAAPGPAEVTQSAEAPAAGPPGTRAASTAAAATTPASSAPVPPSTSPVVAGAPPDTRPAAGSGLVLPAMAMLVETDDPHAVEAALERLTANLQHIVAARSRGEAGPPVRRIPESGGGQVVSVSLGKLFASRTECPFLAALEFSWIVWDRWLIVGTSTRVVRQIVAARRGEGPLLPTALLSQQAADVSRTGATGQMLLVAQPGALAAMLDSWVEYVSRRYPQMLQPEWWRQLERRQRSMRVQLGVVPTARSTPAAVEVGQTLPNYPAFGVLQPGDLILGVNGRPLSADEPLHSLRQMLAIAGESGQVTLRISRGGREQDVAVAMPHADDGAQGVEPIKLIRQAAGFLRPFPTAVYAVWQPAPDLLRCRLELRLGPATRPDGSAATAPADHGR